MLTCVCMRRCWERKVEPMEENGLKYQFVEYVPAPEEALLPSAAEDVQEPPLFAPPADFSAFSGF